MGGPEKRRFKLPRHEREVITEALAHSPLAACATHGQQLLVRSVRLLALRSSVMSSAFTVATFRGAVGAL